MDYSYRILNYFKRNIIANPIISLLNFIFLAGFIICLKSLSSWVYFNADWKVVTNNLPLFISGSFPIEEQWRVYLWLLLLLVLIMTTLSSIRFSQRIHTLIIISWLMIIPLGIFLCAGGLFLQPVPTRYWGGLTLTILLTACSGILALPIGILLALGRQSKLPVINKICTIYIEIIRAIPLIAVLFFGQLLIPLFLPVQIGLNRVLRAIIAFGLFSAGYIAEDVRGGIQSIPITQKEAAYTLGLDNRQVIQFIILPQALRVALPALTNQAVGLLQNTSLMAILGLVELLGITRSLLANPEFIGLYLEAYLFLGTIYWILCTAISSLARKMEKSLSQTNSIRI